MSEGVPAEPLLDSEFECPWPDVLSKDCLSLVRLAATTTAACENPIVGFAVTLMSLPFLQGFDYDGMNWKGFCDDSVLHGPTNPHTIDRVTFIVPSAKLTSPHFKPNSSL